MISNRMIPDEVFSLQSIAKTIFAIVGVVKSNETILVFQSDIPKAFWLRVSWAVLRYSYYSAYQMPLHLSHALEAGATW